MNGRQPTLIDILQPRRFAAHPARTKVTRTIVQPEIDEFERLATDGVKTRPRPGTRKGAGRPAPTAKPS